MENAASLESRAAQAWGDELLARIVCLHGTTCVQVSKAMECVW